jgi:MYXO-CTERM domain-containing protein
VKNFVIKTFVVLAIAGAPAFASAQDTDANTRQTTDVNDRDDNGEWGWLGLLGLAGLLGLKRRDRETVVNRDRATVR